MADEKRKDSEDIELGSLEKNGSFSPPHQEPTKFAPVVTNSNVSNSGPAAVSKFSPGRVSTDRHAKPRFPVSYCISSILMTVTNKVRVPSDSLLTKRADCE